MPVLKTLPKKNPHSNASASTSYLKPSNTDSKALPPLLDLTGEIKKQSQSVQGGGGFADVHKALWGKENVRPQPSATSSLVDARSYGNIGCSQSVAMEFRR